MSASCRILESKVICRQPGRYIGWPTIARTRDGELLVAFSGDRDAHVCPFGKSMLVRSFDDGRRWGGAELINDTPLDDRDTGLCACRDGTLVMSWFTSHYTLEAQMERVARAAPEVQERWRRQVSFVTEQDIAQWAGPRLNPGGRYELGHWTRRSTDGGRTWEEPVRVPPTAPHGPVELSDGRLLFLGNDSFFRDGRTGAIAAAESRDQGRTWSVIGRASMYPAYPGDAPGGVAYLCECHVAETDSPQHLVGVARYEETPREPGRTRSQNLYTFFSSDGGRTWTEPARTPVVGKPGHLLRLADGRLLLSYGHRPAPHGERACLSSDGGRTWDLERECILRADAPSGDLGYPSTAQLPDGSLMTAYYQQERAGEKTVLMATHWALA